MKQEITVTGFADEAHLRRTVAAIREKNWMVVDIYAPYALRGVAELLGRPRSRLPVVVFLGGAVGLLLALWFQFWASTLSWPLNVGGRPWNSLPAFVPVAFESMVLVGGFSLVGAFLLCCRLYPGKPAPQPVVGATNDRFVLVLQAPVTVAAVREVIPDLDLEIVGVDRSLEASQP